MLFDVHSELGHGFTEVVYRRSLALALRQAGLEVLEEVPFPVDFRGHRVGNFRGDLVVDRVVLIEVKALREIDAQAEAQLINYLKASGGGDPARSLPNLGPLMPPRVQKPEISG